MLKRGALMMIISTSLFALVGVLVKMASVDLSNNMVVFFRNLFGLLALMPLVFRGGWGGLRTERLNQHIYRAVAGLAAMYCSFYSFAHMPLADALLLNYTAPLFMPVIAKFSLNEPIPKGLWSILILGFAGVLVVLKPGVEIFQPVALIALLTGLLAAIAQVGIRRLTLTEPTVRIVFYFGLISTLVSAGPASVTWRPPALAGWLLAIGIGTVATVAQLFLTRAYRLAPPAQVGPFIYSTVVVGGILDWLFWGNLPDIFFAVGAVLVISSGVLVIKRMSGVATAQELPAKH